MPRVLWLRSHDRIEEAQSLERTTGLKIESAVALHPEWNGLASRIQLVVVELPIANSTIEQVLSEAQNAVIPIPVVIYDPESILDERIIRPPMTVFRHITGTLNAAEFSGIVNAALEAGVQLQKEASQSREPWRDLLVGESQPMRALHAMIRLVGPRQSTVLITGETGTGKEMVARAIHMASRRAGSRMVSVNCAAIPENLFEAELFGHAKGAFTGAVNDRIGRFEQAHRGSIFLDEVGEIPIEVQPKLLRVLQERELQRVGGSNDIQIDTRVIAASNSDLEQAVGEKKFREDLLYRLNVVPVRVPPLRSRTSDIPLLADHFIEKVCRRESLRLKKLSADALRRLTAYEWPGNVRQLEHAIEMAVTLAGDRTQLYAGDLPLPESKPLPRVAGAPEISFGSDKVNLGEVMGNVERLLLQEALRKCDGNKAKAANMLGIPRTTLVYRVKSLEGCAA